VAKTDQQWWITARGGGSDVRTNQIKPFLFSEVTVRRSLARKMPYVVMESVKEPIYEPHAN